MTLYKLIRSTKKRRNGDRHPCADEICGRHQTPAPRTDRVQGGEIVCTAGRRRSIARCRLVASWGGSTSQGLGCSPIKAVRELGSERRETVRSLSSVRAGELRGAAPSTRGPGWADPWCTSCHANGTAR